MGVISKELTDLNNVRKYCINHLNGQGMKLTTKTPFRALPRLMRYGSIPLSRVYNYSSMITLDSGLTLSSVAGIITNKVGVTVSILANTPRFDYWINPNTLTYHRKGIRLESGDTLVLTTSVTVTGTVLYEYFDNDNNLIRTFTDLSNQTLSITAPEFTSGWLVNTFLFRTILTTEQKNFLLTGNRNVMYYQDFTNSNTLNSVFTLSRLSTATYWNSGGVLSDAGNDVSRFDYGWNKLIWQNQGLLIEKQSTNYAKQTTAANVNIYSDGRSSKTDITLSGLGKGVLLKAETTAADQFTEYGNNLGSVSNIVSFSIFTEVDANSTNYTLLRRVNTYSIYSNDFTYTRTSPTEVTSNKVKSFGLTVGRMSATFSAALAAQSSFYRSMMRGDNLLDNGGGNIAGKTHRTYAAQLEVGIDYVSSFIRVQTSTVTRSPDNFQLNVNNYTGSVLLKYLRQDTGIVESKWLDLSSVTNPILSSYFDVGIWLQSVTVFTATLTDAQKITAMGVGVIDTYSFSAFDSAMAGNILVSRLSSATYWNSSGVNTLVANDIARIDYVYKTSWKIKGLLIEKQSTNYAKGTYGLIATTVTDSTIAAAIDTSKKASRVREVTGSAEPRIQLLNHTVAVNTTITISTFSANLSPYQNLKSVISGDGTSVRFVAFDSSGTMVASVGGSLILGYGTRQINANYRRLYLTTAVTSTSQQFRAGTRNVDAVVSGDTSYGFDLDGVQIEDSSYPTSFITQDTSAATTRAADTPYFKGNPTTAVTGSVYYEFVNQSDDTIKYRIVDITNTVPTIKHSEFESGHIRRIFTFNRTLTTAEKQEIINAFSLV